MKTPVYTLRRATQNNAPDWWQAARFTTAEEGRIAHFQKESDASRPICMPRCTDDFTP